MFGLGGNPSPNPAAAAAAAAAEKEKEKEEESAHEGGTSRADVSPRASVVAAADSANSDSESMLAVSRKQKSRRRSAPAAAAAEAMVIDDPAAKDSEDTAEAPASSDAAPRPPCIIFMDSLNMHRDAEVAVNVSGYLLYEWRARRTDQRAKRAAGDASSSSSSSSEDDDLDAVVEDLLGKGLPLLRPSVPKQLNGWDCGVFALQYAEELFARWPRVDAQTLATQTIRGFSATMFSTADMQVWCLPLLPPARPRPRTAKCVATGKADCVHQFHRWSYS